MAAYELAYTHQAAQDYELCAETAGAALDKDLRSDNGFDLKPQVYTILASCHSAGQEAEKALEVFRAALAEYPSDFGLNFNVSITLMNTGSFAEATTYLERAIASGPN